MHWLDRLTGAFAPVWTLQRQRARAAAEVLLRAYEGAASGRRTATWNRPTGDANSTTMEVANLRQVARDLVRNNPIAAASMDIIADHVVGTGIVAKPMAATRAATNQARDRWKAWAETTACDAAGLHDFAGLEKLVIRTVAESGEALIRRRVRRPEDGLPIPMQLQVLEPDYIDSSRDTLPVRSGAPLSAGRIVQGVEFNGIGRRTGYYLFSEHPGSTFAGSATSSLVPAAEILHVFRLSRPGQVRGVPWLAPIMLRLKELDEYEDAALMKQKIAACLAVITSDMDGTSPALGATDTAQPTLDMLEPGMILNTLPGRQITVVDPPAVNEHGPFVAANLRAIAAGIGLTYEDLTGDYTNLPFSAARMSRLRHWARVDDWRWRMLIPQFCDPAWAWAMQAARVMGLTDTPAAYWTCPPAPMIDPAAEGLAYARNIRSGIQTLSESIRERGYDPDEVFAEMESDNRELDRRGLILDSDARKTTQGGQLQGAAAQSEPIPTAPTNGNGTGASHGAP